MSSYILFELVKSAVVLMIVGALLLIERWRRNHPHPPSFPE
ncbi:hypothetical protein [Desulfobulbus elongatus]|nr:hypothetical protein [Desulfobulbus elongatus]